MSHFVFETTDGQYISTRKNTGRGYEARVTLSNLDGARIFNTKAAASNAGNQAGVDGKVLPVALTVLG